MTSRADPERKEEGARPIALVGMACRFPGVATNLSAFWRLLVSAETAVGPVPEERWSSARYYDPDPDSPGKMYTRHGGFVEGIDGFDARFFDTTHREAVAMDPQQRLLLEVAWHALEHAGCAPDSLRESRTGVFVGITFADYLERLRREGDEGVDAYHLSGNALNFAAGRLAHKLGLRGPCMALDTACSSSLVAVHLACQSLALGESDLALAAGVNAIFDPLWTVSACRAGMLSPDGACRTFDKAANGYVRGEGCGVIVLRRLEDALARKEPVIAVVRGSAVNHDGPSGGLTVPSAEAQTDLIRTALSRA